MIVVLPQTIKFLKI